MKAITTNEGAVKFHLNGQLIRTVPKGSFTTQIDWKRESVVVSINGTTTYYDFPLGTTIDGNDPGTLEDLADALSAFSRGGGDGNGVTSVTGDLVDDTDPQNVIVNLPDNVVLEGELGDLAQINFPPSPSNTTVPNAMGSWLDLSTEYYTQAQINTRIPAPPATGNYTLRSVDGVVSWVEDE